MYSLWGLKLYSLWDEVDKMAHNQHTATKWTPELRETLVDIIETNKESKPLSKLDICRFLKIGERTLGDWCNQFEDFREIYEQNLVYRKSFEIERYIRGETDYKYFQFVMRYCYGEIEACKQVELSLKERELEHKIANPNDNSNEPIKFEFTIKQPNENGIA